MEMLLIFSNIILYGAFAVSISLLVISGVLIIITNPYPKVERYKEEETYRDHKTNTKQKFPDFNESYDVNLTVVVPAYNEQDRLPTMLDETLEFLENRLKDYPTYKYEIIVVSDGSKDKTVEVAETYAKKFGSEKLRCLELIKNRGKGGAVRLELCRICNHAAPSYALLGYCLFFKPILANLYNNFADSDSGVAKILLQPPMSEQDADGASKFEDLTKLEVALRDILQCDPITQPEDVTDRHALVIGSRAHLEQESLAKRSIFRNILMYGFHFLVWLFTVKGIKDTQCGFKLFTRKTAKTCFQSLHVNRWAFDVELLYIAQTLNIPIAEIPVRWTEIEGSKVTPVLSWIQMGVDLGLIWLKYKTGAWKIRRDKKE